MAGGEHSRTPGKLEMVLTMHLAFNEPALWENAFSLQC